MTLKPNTKIKDPAINKKDSIMATGHSLSRTAQFYRFVTGILKQHPKQIAITLCLGIAATLTQIGLAYYLFRLIQAGGEPLEIFSITLIGMKLWIIPVFLALAAAIIPYLAELYIIKATVKFFKQSIKEVAEALSETDRRYKLFLLTENNSALSRLMSSDARYASLAFSGILRLAFPVTMSLTAFALLFNFSAKWATIIILLMSPFVVWQLRVVMSGAKLNRHLRETGVSHSRAVSKYVGALSTHFTANRWGESLKTELSSLITDVFPNAYGERLRLGISTRVVGDLAVAGLILFICGLVITGNLTLENFSHVLIYAIILRFALTNLSRTIVGMISIISQLPFYENYIAAQNILRSNSISNPSWVSNQESAIYDKIKPNQLHVFFSNEPLNWLIVFKFLMKKNGYDAARRFIGKTLLVSGTFQNFSNDFVKELQTPATIDEVSFLKMFPASSHRWPDFLTTIANVDNIDENWTEVPRSIKFLCSMKYAERKKRGGAYVFINGSDFLTLTSNEKEWAISTLKNTTIILVFNRVYRQNLIPAVSNFFIINTQSELQHISHDQNDGDIMPQVKLLLETQKKRLTAKHNSFDDMSDL